MHMKKQLNRLVFILILIFISLPGFSQIFKGEVITGFNLSQVDGDFAYRFKKLGFVGGVGVVAPIYKNWSLSLETLYSQKGSKQKAQFEDSLDGSYKLILNYAEVPLMIQYTDRDIVSAGVGVSWNRLFYVEEWRNGYRVDSVTPKSGIFDRDDFIAFGDVRVRVYKNLILNARYSYSMDKIATRMMVNPDTGKPEKRDFYNNLWSIRLIYMINEKRADKNDRKPAPAN